MQRNRPKQVSRVSGWKGVEIQFVPAVNASLSTDGTIFRMKKYKQEDAIIEARQYIADEAVFSSDNYVQPTPQPRVDYRILPWPIWLHESFCFTVESEPRWLRSTSVIECSFFYLRGGRPTRVIGVTSTVNHWWLFNQLAGSRCTPCASTTIWTCGILHHWWIARL